jgi:hypothetical protein
MPRFRDPAIVWDDELGGFRRVDPKPTQKPASPDEKRAIARQSVTRLLGAAFGVRFSDGSTTTVPAHLRPYVGGSTAGVKRPT